MAGIYFPQQELNIVLNPDISTFFREFRIGFHHTAEARFPDSPKIKHLITCTSDKNRERREKKTYPGFSYGLWINPYRQFSFHFWAEGIDEKGIPHLSPSFHATVDELARECLGIDPSVSELPELTYLSKLEDGTSMIRPAVLFSKTPIVKVFLDAVGNISGPVYMIGDSRFDFINDHRVTTLAVGNADIQLQELIA